MVSLKNNITVSAPGKLMLFGEHAVVYGHPCLVTAVDQRMHATVEILDKPEFQLEAADVNVSGYKKPMSDLGKGEIPKGAKFVEIAVKNFLRKSPAFEIPPTPFTKGGVRRTGDLGWRDLKGIKITTSSEFSSQFGFGSSSAVTVCVIKALSELTGKKLTQKQIFSLAYKTILDIQSKGSGFDVAVATFGGTLYFVTAGRIIQPLKIKTLPLIVGYSGIKADTVSLITQVKEKFADKNQRLLEMYNEMEKLVNKAKPEIVSKNWEKVGKLMSANQKLLVELGVSTKNLDGMINAAREAGAYGAKLSGAGGGDCIIALAPENSRAAVETAITKAGGEIITVQTNAEGVKVEV